MVGNTFINIVCAPKVPLYATADVWPDKSASIFYAFQKWKRKSVICEHLRFVRSRVD